MKLLDGESIVSMLQDEGLVLTNLRVSQGEAYGSSFQRKHIFLKNVTSCELVCNKDDKWLVGAIASFTFAGICFIAQLMQGGIVAIVCMTAFSALYFFSNTVTLVIASPSTSIEHVSRDSCKGARSFKLLLDKLVAEKGKVLGLLYICVTTDILF